MIIKRYVVKDMNEAFVKIRQELGRDAVIISQRKVRKPGLKGFFAPKQVEVTACVDRSSGEQSQVAQSPQPQAMSEDREFLKKMIRDKQPEVNGAKKNDSSKQQMDLQGEITEMKKMLTDVVSLAKDHQGTKTDLEKFLIENDVNESMAREIALKAQLLSGNEEDMEKLKEIVYEICSVSEVEMRGPVVFVGPTGVGKTTTIAKLAGRLALVEKKKVGLITIDTYRIGAIEQLKTYAEIMNIPFKVVMTLKDMEEAVSGMEGCDAVLIDTTGRSSRNAMQISELRAYIEKVNTENIHLVISCTTKAKDIVNIVSGYQVLGFNHVIVTKLDETATYGSMLNILEASGKPVSFITTGQSVPDDIKRVSKEELMSLIMGEDGIC